MSDKAVTAGFHARVYQAVRQVPAGSITTYGDVAATLGSPRVARHVGWALSALRDESVPWHRVINAQGRISGRGEVERADTQLALLESEGIVFHNEQADLKRYRWRFSVEEFSDG